MGLVAHGRYTSHMHVANPSWHCVETCQLILKPLADVESECAKGPGINGFNKDHEVSGKRNGEDDSNTI